MKQPRELLQVLSALVRWFNHQEVPYTIIGGVAVSLVSQPRATQDIDAVAWIDLDNAEAFVDSGQAFGFQARISDPIGFARRNRVLLLRHAESEIGIDVSLGALPLEREVLDRALEFNIGGTILRVATPEDLIILKAIAHRKRDLIDIDTLLDVHENLDVARMRNWIQQFADVLESPEILNDFTNLLENRKRHS
ncbi:MAG TPA: nucleotidyl transferase AbiEii/AbiGii toxin family protein [Pyrinomonadaceae bacterium]|nr:nucleotidyl transferase AbiEii/AbiGii toxin family protein [Pyrinomonadaceae bacterium]